jgi:hypothetical protein
MKECACRAAFWSIALGWAASMFGCEALLGFNDLEPRRAEASVEGEDDLDASEAGGADAPDGEVEEPELDARSEGESEAGGEQPELDAGQPASNDAAPGAGDGASGQDAAPEAGAQPDASECLLPTGQDLCQTLPKFAAASQVVDGVGDEFCGIPAMTFDAVSCPTVDPDPPPALPASVSLRVAWSAQAVHLHVRVQDPAIIVQPDRARLWNGDSVEIYIAGASGAQLTGAFDGTNDGGAIQLVLTPPSGAFPARGEAFFSRFGAHSEIDPSLYAGRLIPGGYELELRFPWPSSANPATPGARVAFDFALGVQDAASAGGRQLQCIISDVFVDGAQACGLAAGTAAAPYCDDRTWCQPELLP